MIFWIKRLPLRCIYRGLTHCWTPAIHTARLYELHSALDFLRSGLRWPHYQAIVLVEKSSKAWPITKGAEGQRILDCK